MVISVPEGSFLVPNDACADPELDRFNLQSRPARSARPVPGLASLSSFPETSPFNMVNTPRNHFETNRVPSSGDPHRGRSARLKRARRVLVVGCDSARGTHPRGASTDRGFSPQFTSSFVLASPVPGSFRKLLENRTFWPDLGWPQNHHSSSFDP